MKNTKRARLEAHGWRVGSAAEFLELTPEEAAFLDEARVEPMRSQPAHGAERFAGSAGETPEIESVTRSQDGSRGCHCVHRSITASLIRFRCQATRHSGRDSEGANRCSLKLRMPHPVTAGARR